MRDRERKPLFLKRVSAGCAAAVMSLTTLAVLFRNSPSVPEFLLYETLPFYDYRIDLPVSPEAVRFMHTEDKENTGDTNKDAETYTPPETPSPPQTTALPEHNPIHDFNYLSSYIYNIERDSFGNKTTGMLPDLFDAEQFSAADLTLSGYDGPKVLIFSTHSTEMYADAPEGTDMQGVLGVGAVLCEILNERYGIEAMHCTEQFDIVGGYAQISGAYDRASRAIEQILRENPSIEVVIDIHRDGVEDGLRLVVGINSTDQAAQIMFVNGMSAAYQNGVLTNLDYLPNKNLETNLAFSYALQTYGNILYPKIMRKIYLKPYRYSLHLAPKTILAEIGAQTNTTAEALKAVEILAELLSLVLRKP